MYGASHRLVKPENLKSITIDFDTAEVTFLFGKIQLNNFLVVALEYYFKWIKFENYQVNSTEAQMTEINQIKAMINKNYKVMEKPINIPL
jgi:hypothetical protein